MIQHYVKVAIRSLLKHKVHYITVCMIPLSYFPCRYPLFHLYVIEPLPIYTDYSTLGDERIRVDIHD